jgi:hypothetical protein
MDWLAPGLLLLLLATSAIFFPVVREPPSQGEVPASSQVAEPVDPANSPSPLGEPAQPVQATGPAVDADMRAAEADSPMVEPYEQSSDARMDVERETAVGTSGAANTALPYFMTHGSLTEAVPPAALNSPQLSDDAVSNRSDHAPAGMIPSTVADRETSSPETQESVAQSKVKKPPKKKPSLRVQRRGAVSPTASTPEAPSPGVSDSASSIGTLY